MFQEQLHNFGLTKAQSAVLGSLLEHGEAKASQIARSVSHPRGVVYKTLEELLALELVEKQEKEGQIAKFRAVHPRNLEKLLENKERELQRNKKIFEDLLPQMASNYNLALNKPGIKFYEGEEGLEKVLYDTLKSKTEVYLLFNKEAMEKEDIFRDINEEYKRRRIQAQIKKKIIRVGEKPELVFGTTEDKYDLITEIRYLDKPNSLFKTNIHIYDGKISFLIMEQGKIIGILIEDKNIYELNKLCFETLWETAS